MSNEQRAVTPEMIEAARRSLERNGVFALHCDLEDACAAMFGVTPTRTDDTERLDWLQDNELDLVTLREESTEGEYLILWFVVDGRLSTKRALHSVSGHPLGCPREAIDAAKAASATNKDVSHERD